MAKLPKKEIIDAGCYIDFEGFASNQHRTSPPPILLGAFNIDGDREFQRFVFTESYRWAALSSSTDRRVEYIPNRAKFLRKLVSTTRKRSPFFAFSEHEKNIIEAETNMGISSRYRNVRSISSTWYNQNPAVGSRPGSNSLIDVAKSLNLVTLSKLEKGGVTERLRIVREHSASKIKWKSAPLMAKRAWEEILQHNESDVVLMYQILKALHSAK